MKRSRHSAFTKLTALLLILTMTIAITACADKSNQTTDTNADTSDVASTTAEDTEILPDLPDVTYDGAEFSILISSNDEAGVVKNDFAATEMNGEVINDARFTRNSTIEDKYDIDIVDYPTAAGANGAGIAAIKKSVTAADYAYDAAMMAGYDTCALASNDFLVDLKTLGYIDLNKPWWDQKANADLTIKGKMFYTTGDISTADNDATYAILFNKQLVTDYKLPDYYSLVKDGTWTIDKFCESVVQVHSDLDGNGEYDTNDLFGALLWDDTMMGIVNATGDKCCTVNSDGQIELTLNTERVVTMIQKYFSVAFDKSVCLTYQRKNWDGVAAVNMFSNNQALFFMRLLLDVASMRNMEADFGILPYPKYDDTQTEYYNTVGSWHSVFMCVPKVQENAERTGVLLEALAAESMKTLTPAYYDISLKGKYTRDNESSDMLDIILATRTFDLGWYYQVGTYNEAVMNLLRNFKSDFSSMYAKLEKNANKQVDKLNTAFAEISTNN
jgi:hypothetical protein